MDVLAFGSVISDVLVKSKQVKVKQEKGKKYFFINYGSKIEAENIEATFGGSAHNIAYGIASLGKKSGLIGCIGKDEYGEAILNSLKQIGVNTDGVQQTEMPTGKSIVIIGEDNERTIIIFRGANDYIDAKKLSKEYINLFRYFVFTSVTSEKSINALDKALRFAKQSGLNNSCKPKRQYDKGKKKGFDRIFRQITNSNNE